ncbi:MAG: amidohydrolase [Phascolarctobacterium sp.]|nr:amidohydrolase [Phascolarctobacterium sp.]
MDILGHINTIWPQLHEMAEPAFKEVNTASFLAGFLRKLGYEVETGVGGTTAVVATLDSGRPGPIVAVRTDMDCLLFKQEDGSECPIHACGHDGHMTIALGVAQLAAEQGLPCGKLKILCQPAEEIGKGALVLLEAGALENVDYALGYHLMPQDLARSGQIIAQINWTACTLMEGELRGLAAHGSQPHLGINAIDVGAAIVNAINALPTNPLLGGSVKTTRFIGGAGSLNAICDNVKIGFDLRSTSNAEMLELRQRVADIVVNTAKVYGAEAECHIVGTCPAAEADPSLLNLTREVIISELGSDGLIPAINITVGEDFNFFKEQRPALKTASLGIGCDLVPRLHDPDMHFEHAALEPAIKVLTKLALQILQTKP